MVLKSLYKLMVFKKNSNHEYTYSFGFLDNEEIDNYAIKKKTYFIYKKIRKSIWLKFFYSYNIIWEIIRMNLKDLYVLYWLMKKYRWLIVDRILISLVKIDA